MGQKSPTETLFGIIAAFVERPRWSQADLARKLETNPPTIRKHLVQLQKGGFPLVDKKEPPQVYWSVPKDWFPGAVPFKADEVPDLLRLLGRTQSSALRQRVRSIVVSRLANVGALGAGLADDAVRTHAVDEDEEKTIDVIEDAMRSKVAIKMRYYTASRQKWDVRHVSPHRLDMRVRPQLIATCHRSGEIRRFRVRNISEARLDRSQAFTAASPEDLARFDAESFGGFRQKGPIVRCAFTVREKDSGWVEGNLPDDRFQKEPLPEGGLRFRIDTTAVNALARYVVSLGDAARCETPELAEAVAAIARGALAGAERPG